MATHFIFIVSGSLPSGTVGKGKFSLIGCDGSALQCRNVTNSVSLLGLRMAEVLEWAVCRNALGVNRDKQNPTDSKNSSGLSISSFFGLGGSSKKADSKHDAEGVAKVDVPKKVPSTESISAEKALRVRIALCFPKLKFAMLLADLGLTDVAINYATDAREVVRMCRNSGEFY